MTGNAKRKHELLSGPLMKIERAKQHINDANRQVTEFLRKKPFELRVSEHRDPQRRIVYVKANQPIPSVITLILGDTVHNLRSALDQLCWGMVGSQAQTPKSVGFPFVERKDALGSAIATRQMNIAPEKVIKEIHALEPYPSGNKYLHAVKSLAETDKHRNVLVVGTGVEVTIPQLEALIHPHKTELPQNLIIAVVGDFVVNNLPPGAVVEPFDKKADIQPTFTIGFGHGEALESYPLVFALTEMAKSTETAVRALARAYCS